MNVRSKGFDGIRYHKRKDCCGQMENAGILFGGLFFNYGMGFHGFHPGDKFTGDLML